MASCIIVLRKVKQEILVFRGGGDNIALGEVAHEPGRGRGCAAFFEPTTSIGGGDNAAAGGHSAKTDASRNL